MLACNTRNALKVSGPNLGRIGGLIIFIIVGTTCFFVVVRRCFSLFVVVVVVVVVVFLLSCVIVSVVLSRYFERCSSVQMMSDVASVCGHGLYSNTTLNISLYIYVYFIMFSCRCLQSQLLLKDEGMVLKEERTSGPKSSSSICQALQGQGVQTDENLDPTEGSENHDQFFW